MEGMGPKSGLWVHMLLLDRPMMQRETEIENRQKVEGAGRRKKRRRKSSGTFQKSKSSFNF